MFPKDTTATNSSKSFKFGENQKEKTRMEHRIIPCAEGDDKFIADKLNAITNSKIDFEDTIGDGCSTFQGKHIEREDPRGIQSGRYGYVRVPARCCI